MSRAGISAVAELLVIFLNENVTDVVLCVLMYTDISLPYGRGREPSLRDEILVFVVMAAMFLGLLIIVNFTRNRGRRRLYMPFDELPLL